MTRRQGQEDVKMLSQITATFSVGLCVRSEGSTMCQITDTNTVHVVGITQNMLFISFSCFSKPFNACNDCTAASCGSDYSFVLYFLFIAGKQQVFCYTIYNNQSYKLLFNYAFNQRDLPTLAP